VGDIRASKAIFAGQSVPLILSRLIGQSRTMDLLITGRVIDAVEAERYGIVVRVWPVETYEHDLAAFLAARDAGERVEIDREMFEYWLDVLPPVFMYRPVELPDGKIVNALCGFAEGDEPVTVFWREGDRYFAERIKDGR